jgi:hypothetical protein
MKFTSIEMVKMYAREKGSHFFDLEAMRFFSSRVSRKLFGEDGSVFVTSERHEHPYYEPLPRRFTVRQISKDGSIETVGTFQQFETQDEAFAFARTYVSTNNKGDN